MASAWKTCSPAALCTRLIAAEVGFALGQEATGPRGRSRVGNSRALLAVLGNFVWRSMKQTSTDRWQ